MYNMFNVYDWYIGLEAHTVLSYTLLYTGVQLERHRANKDQDYGNIIM